MRTLVRDLYAYLLPGLAVTVLIGGPLRWGRWADTVGEVLFAVAIAGVAGLIAAELARPVLRAPRLDLGQLPEALRVAWTRAVGARLELDLSDEETRQEALKLASTRLSQQGHGAYAERLRSLQALALGLYGALRLASAWAVGLVAGSLPDAVGLFLLVVLGLLLARRQGILDHALDATPWLANPALRLPLVMALVAGAGWALSPYPGTVRVWIVGALVVLAIELLARQARISHDDFARRHDMEVVRSFTVLATAP